MIVALPQKTMGILSKEIQAMVAQDGVFIDLTVEWSSALGQSAEETKELYCAEVRAQCLQMWMQNTFLESKQAKSFLENKVFTKEEILQGVSLLELRQNEANRVIQEVDGYHWSAFGAKETLNALPKSKAISGTASDSLQQLRKFIFSHRIAGGVTVSPDTILSSAVSLRAIETLEDGRWLDSEVLNFAFTQHALNTGACSTIFPETLHDNTGSPKIYYADTYFLPGTVLKHIRKEQMLEDYDILVIPAHLNKNHYVVAMVDCKSGLVESFDSLGGAQERFREALLDWLKLQAPKIAWHSNAADCPQQKNFVDCGIFALLAGTYAHLRTAETPLDFFYSQDDIPKIRNHLVHAIVQVGNRFRNCRPWTPFT
jgi:hypothetical protein